MLILLLCLQILYFAQETVEVEIQPPYQTVNTVEGTSVTLPCKIRTLCPYNPIIIWCLGHPASGSVMLRVNTAGALSIRPNYTGRIKLEGEPKMVAVAPGIAEPTERVCQANLVVISPELSDSGNYSCEARITIDVPPIATAFVYLNVSQKKFTDRMNPALIGVVIGVDAFAVLSVFCHLPLLESGCPAMSSGFRVTFLLFNVCWILLCLSACCLLLEAVFGSGDFTSTGVILSIVGLVGCSLYHLYHVISYCVRRSKDKDHNRDKDTQRNALDENSKFLTNLIETSDLLRKYYAKDQDIFVETESYIPVKGLLENHSSVLILGNPGEGKTTLLKAVCLDFAKRGFVIVPCDCPTKIVMSCVGITKNVVIVVDDAFGVMGRDPDKARAWNQEAGEVSKLTALLHNGRVKIILACRTVIWSDYEELLGNSPLFDNRVELSSSSIHEHTRRQFLQAHVSSRVISQFQYAVNSICMEDDLVAFPQTCGMISKLNIPILSGEEFAEIFRFPFRILLRHINLLHCQDPWKYASLCLVMLKGGRLYWRDFLHEDTSRSNAIISAVLSVCGLEKSVTAEALIGDSLEKLHGSYLMKEETRLGPLFCFRNSSFFDAVAVSLGKRDSLLILRHCQSDFIVTRCDIVTPDAQTRNTILVPRRLYPNFVAHLTREVLDGHLPSVFKHPSLRDTELQEIWTDHLRTLPSGELSLFANMGVDRERFGGNILYYAARAGAQKLMMFLMKHGAKCSAYIIYFPIVGAAEGGHLDIVKWCLTQSSEMTGLTLDLNDNFASNSEHTALQTEAVPEALIAAAKNGHVKVLQFLLDVSGPENVDLLLLCAVRHNQIKTVEFLLQCNFTADSINDAMETAKGKRFEHLYNILKKNVRDTRETSVYPSTSGYSGSQRLSFGKSSRDTGGNHKYNEERIKFGKAMDSEEGAVAHSYTKHDETERSCGEVSESGSLLQEQMASPADSNITAPIILPEDTTDNSFSRDSGVFTKRAQESQC